MSSTSYGRAESAIASFIPEELSSHIYTHPVMGESRDGGGAEEPPGDGDVSEGVRTWSNSNENENVSEGVRTNSNETERTDDSLVVGVLRTDVSEGVRTWSNSNGTERTDDSLVVGDVSEGVRTWSNSNMVQLSEVERTDDSLVVGVTCPRE